MSDTLLEPEDQNARLIGNPNENADWCDDCHGYTHMPWCPAYKEPVKEAMWCPACGTLNCVNPANHQAATSEHQPAARGGGDEWCYVETKYSAKIDCGEFELRPQWNGGLDPELLRSSIREAVDRHNQHQALVAERERLRRALEVIRDSYWSENEPYSERVEYLQQFARDALDVKGGPQ